MISREGEVEVVSQIAGSEGSMDLKMPSSVGLVPKCRHCGYDLTLKLIDLGLSPVANDYVEGQRAICILLPFYPLEALVCWRMPPGPDARSVEGFGYLPSGLLAYFSSHSDVVV